MTHIEEIVLDEECPICFQVYDTEHAPKIIPCSDGHVVCLVCIQNLIASNRVENRLCYLFGERCDKEVHIPCPLCRNVVHMPSNGSSELITLPLNAGERDELLEYRRIQNRVLRKKIEELTSETSSVIKLIDELIEDINRHAHSCRVARITGSTNAAIGAVLGGVGLILIPFTFGGSLGLSIAGGVLGVAGGSVVAGTTLTEFILERQKLQIAQAKCDSINTLEMDVADIMINMGRTAQVAGAGVRVASEIVEGVTTGVRLGAAVGTRIGMSAARGAAIASGVIGLVLLPLDIYTVVTDSIAIHKTEPSKISEKLLQVRNDLLDRRKNIIEPLVKANDFINMFGTI